MGFEVIDQGLKLTIGVVVTDGIPRTFPDMLLRVQIGAGRWEEDHLQAVGLLNQVGHFTKMPGSTIRQDVESAVDRVSTGLSGNWLSFRWLFRVLRGRSPDRRAGSMRHRNAHDRAADAPPQSAFAQQLPTRAWSSPEM